MNKFTRILAVLAGFAAVAASAVPINITVGTNGQLLNGVGIANNTQYGQGNNNAGSNYNFLLQEVGYWNNANLNPDVPSPLDGLVDLDQGSLGNISNYIAQTSYQYVVFHFGNGGQGSPGGWWQAFYLGGDGGSFSVPVIPGGGAVGGFSSARYFDGSSRVPDSATTVALLGMSLVAVAFVARRKQLA